MDEYSLSHRAALEIGTVSATPAATPLTVSLRAEPATATPGHLLLAARYEPARDPIPAAPPTNGPLPSA